MARLCHVGSRLVARCATGTCKSSNTWRADRHAPVDGDGPGLHGGEPLRGLRSREQAAQGAVQSLVAIFEQRRASSRTLALFDQWTLDLGNASGPFSPSDLDEWAALCLSLGVPRSVESANHVLFGIQTYFAIVAKLAALIVLEGATGSSLSDRLAASGDIREGFSRLESGELTASTGTLNAIEPGVFSWYLTESSVEIDQTLRLLAALTNEYVAEVVEITPLVARDVMKNLYQRLLPRSIRHRLGEYYTPDWLAQRVVNQVTGSNETLASTTRVLDPACGSGTFLVEVIARMVRTAAGQSPQRTLQQITENVVGFDLSPLAVQAAKVNYLLALAPLLRFATEPISLPIFLADSVSPPKRGGLLDGDVYLFESSEGQWRVPTSLAAAQYLPVLGALFDEALDPARDARWLRDQATQRLPLSNTADGPTLDEIERLFEKLGDLHQAGRDGMWWQLIRNAFAPSLYEPFDFVVGNPPWVSWETLPEPYRRDNDEQWLAYGLRPDAPPDRRQASTNVPVDISMLFVARCIDRYLRQGGRLGFVITATVFQSELAGRGFRRRRLGPGATYRFAYIDDLSALQVFEAATNQTAVLIAEKESADVAAPVPVSLWEGVGSRTISTSLELDEVTRITRRRNLYAEPADPSDEASPLLMMPRAGLAASRPLRHRSVYLDTIRKGIDTRGANGIFFLRFADAPDNMLHIENLPEDGRNRRLAKRRATVERQAVRRLLRGSDVKAGVAEPSTGILFFHDEEHVSYPMGPEEAERTVPQAFAFAKAFEGDLRGRRKFRNFDPTGDAWLGVYSVTAAALAEHKVVVREIAAGMIAAPVHGRDIIPDHKLYVIPCGSALEADRLSAVLSCRVVDYLLRSFSVSTSITGSFLRYIGVGDLSKVDPSLQLGRSMSR